MPNKVNYTPKGSHTLTPFFTVKPADKAIEFYKKAFGAQELSRMPSPDGKIMHAELKIGDSPFMLSDEFPDMPGKMLAPSTLKGSSMGLYIYVPDVDSAFKKAIAAGAKSDMEPTDMFWGDRFSSVTDPFGHKWSLGTHKEDLTQDQINKRAEEFFAHSARK